MDEKEYHDLLAGRFKVRYNDGMNKSLKRQIRLRLEDFCSYVPTRSVRILDAGCHDGYALKRLKQLGYTHAEGVEYLQILVRSVHRKACKAQQGDLHNLHMFADGVFDAIFSRYVLEHCHTASKAVQELVRILKPGGTMYIVVSSEIDGIQTRQGSTVFKSVEDFKMLIPSNMKTIKLETPKTFMGWYDIIYVGIKE